MDKSTQNGLGANSVNVNAPRKSLFVPKHWEGTESVGMHSHVGAVSYANYYPVAKGMKLWNNIPSRPNDVSSAVGVNSAVKTLPNRVVASSDEIGVKQGSETLVNVDYNYNFAQDSNENVIEKDTTRQVLVDQVEVMSVDESLTASPNVKVAREKLDLSIDENESLGSFEPNENLNVVAQPIVTSQVRETTPTSPFNNATSSKPMEFVAPRPHYGKGNVNPFAAFATRSVLTEQDVTFIRGALNSGIYSQEALLKYFKQILSPSNAQMLNNITSVLTDYMQNYHKARPLVVRLFSFALAFCTDDFVHAYTPNMLNGLFTPQVDDDIGGGFIRVLLNYRSAFNSPGSTQVGLPVAIDSNGHLVYRQVSCHDNVDVSCGKIETLVMLKIAMERAKVTSAFDLPSSRLRDWICSIWYELPLTRPRMPLIKLSLHWIDARVDDETLKDGAFALLCDYIQRLNAKDEAVLAAAGLGVSTFLGTKVLLMHFFSFCFSKRANVHPQLERLLELIVVNEEDLYIALDAIVVAWTESEMLDLWCCLSMIPWTLDQAPSPLLVLMTTLLRVYYNMALHSIDFSAVNPSLTSPPLLEPKASSLSSNVSTPSIGLIEGCIRISTCRFSSPLLAHVALLQCIHLIGTSEYAIVSCAQAPLLLKSLPQLMYKYYFLWSHVKDCVDFTTLQLLKELYGMISLVVDCKALDSISDLPMNWTRPNEPLFPRCRQLLGNSSDAEVDSDVVLHYNSSRNNAPVAVGLRSFFKAEDSVAPPSPSPLLQHQHHQLQQRQQQQLTSHLEGQNMTRLLQPLQNDLQGMLAQPQVGNVQRNLASSVAMQQPNDVLQFQEQLQHYDSQAPGDYISMVTRAQVLNFDEIPAQESPNLKVSKCNRRKDPRRKRTYQYESPGPCALVPESNMRPCARNVCGLKNIGNTCYFNSMIQALYHTRYFVHCLDTLNIQSELARSLRKLFSRLASRSEAFSPSSTLALLPDHLNNGEQQDVTEFYRFLLESLDPNNSSGIWTKVFAGLTVQHVRCLKCHNVSSTESTIYDFTLCTSNNSLKSLFDGFSRRERLTGENKYTCSPCNKKQNAEMWVEIASPPAHIIVILGRNMGSSGEKDTSRVALESELEVGSFYYRIYGAIFHSGATSNSGHYYFIGCDSEALEPWHRFNDSNVVSIDPRVLTLGNWDNSHVPYVVFYRCLDAPPTPIMHH